MKHIAWVGHIEERSGIDEFVLEREGMTREEIVAAFPPSRIWKAQGKTYNRKALIRAIVQEAYEEAGARDRKNIRGFWYERFFYVLGAIMREPLDDANKASIDSTINQVWGELVENGEVTYDELNLYSEKESLYHISVRENSPYPTSIVIVEKASLFNGLKDIADTFEMSLCCTGGQGSRAAALAYLAKLNRMGIDLNQQFTVYSFCDFDPEGWDIPYTFVEHLGIEILDIRLVRLGVLKEQIGESVLQHQTIPYSFDAKTERARKAKRTKYERFLGETGGVFMPGTGEPARVELDMYSDVQIREKILRGLATHIDGFKYQVPGLKTALGEQYKRWESHMGDEASDAIDELVTPYAKAIEEAQERLRIDQSNIGLSLRQQIGALEQEKDRLHSKLWAEIEASGIPAKLEALSTWYDEHLNDLNEVEVRWNGEWKTLENLKAIITDNGDWRGWAEELDLEIIDGDALADSARKHRRFHYVTTTTDDEKIYDWVDDSNGSVYPEAWVDGYDPFTDLDPWELVDWILEGVDGD